MTDHDPDRSHHDDPHAPAGPHSLPDPPSRRLKDGTVLSIKDVYLGDISDPDKLWMPLYILRFRRSYFYELANNEQLGAALRLWMAAWIAKPAASIKAEDRLIAKVAGYDISNQHCLQCWHQCRDLVLHGWILCSDGRMYHLDLANIALDQAEKLHGRQQSMENARANIGKGRRKSKRQKTVLKSVPKTDQSSELKPGIELDRDQRFKEPPNPASGESGAATKWGLRAEGQNARAQGTSPRQTGTNARAAGTNPRASRDIDPEAAAIRKQATSNASLEAEFGMTAAAMVDALHQACAGSNRLIRNSPKLEDASAIIELLRTNPGMSFREDVLPAISGAVERSGPTVGSWAFFADRIKAWHQNRKAGIAQPGQQQRGSKAVYDPEDRPDWWHGRDKGVSPPGHPWKAKIDPYTKELRRYNDVWDWQWYDAVKRYVDTGGWPNGVWDEEVQDKRPGRPSSLCPDDICAAFGIVPIPHKPVKRPSVVVPIRARENGSAGQGEAFRASSSPDTGRLATAMGGLPNGSARHGGPAPDVVGLEDSDPPL